MATRIKLSGVSLNVLQAVLTESSVQREHAAVNLADGEQWAPQVSCGGSRDGAMVYTIETAPFDLAGAKAIMDAAARAETE